MVEELYTPEQLAQMHDSLWQCVLQFANLSAAQERNRIARDLHDSVGHALTALNFQLQTAIKLYKPDPNQAEEFLTEAQRLVKLATQEVRQSVKALRSDTLETQPLETLIQSLVDDLRSTIGVEPTLKLNILTPPPSQLVVPVYRVVQEALNNIRKYAQATSVIIDVCVTDSEIQLLICDNGRGFDPNSVAGGYGLQGMHERVAVLKGLFMVESSPGNGCQIHVWLPTHLSTPPIGTTPRDTVLEPPNISKKALSLIEPESLRDTPQESLRDRNIQTLPISAFSVPTPPAYPEQNNPEQSNNVNPVVSTRNLPDLRLPDLSALMSEINLDLSYLLTNPEQVEVSERRQDWMKNHHEIGSIEVNQIEVNQIPSKPELSRSGCRSAINQKGSIKIGEWQQFDLF